MKGTKYWDNPGPLSKVRGLRGFLGMAYGLGVIGFLGFLGYVLVVETFRHSRMTKDDIVE